MPNYQARKNMLYMCWSACRPGCTTCHIITIWLPCHHLYDYHVIVCAATMSSLVQPPHVNAAVQPVSGPGDNCIMVTIMCFLLLPIALKICLLRRRSCRNRLACCLTRPIQRGWPDQAHPTCCPAQLVPLARPVCSHLAYPGAAS